MRNFGGDAILLKIDKFNKHFPEINKTKKNAIKYSKAGKWVLVKVKEKTKQNEKNALKNHNQSEERQFFTVHPPILA